MKGFLEQKFQTDNIENIPYSELKKCIKGDSLSGRIKFRMKFAKSLTIKETVFNRFTNKVIKK